MASAALLSLLFLTIELLRGFPDLRDLYVESWVALRVDRRVEQ